jgi:hypothetical protein
MSCPRIGSDKRAGPARSHTFEHVNIPVSIIRRLVEQVLQGFDAVHVKLVQCAVDARDLRDPQSLADSAKPSQFVDLPGQSTLSFEFRVVAILFAKIELPTLQQGAR